MVESPFYYETWAREGLEKKEKRHLKFSEDSLKPWHHVGQHVVYITDSSVAPHKHILKVWFSTCHLATAGMFFVFFSSLTNTKFSSGLAGHSPLSKQLSTKFCFFSDFEELDVRHSGELREFISASDGELGYGEVWGCPVQRWTSTISLHEIMSLFLWKERKPQSHGQKGHSGSWDTENQAFSSSQCPSTSRVTLDLGRRTVGKQRGFIESQNG